MAKKELFDKELQRVADIFKVLGHPARLAILKYLAESNTCITGDISNELPLSRTTINQHLAELKSLGFIHGEIDGVKVYYCINQDKLEELWQFARSMINNMAEKNKLKCCGD